MTLLGDSPPDMPTAMLLLHHDAATQRETQLQLKAAILALCLS